MSNEKPDSITATSRSSMDHHDNTRPAPTSFPKEVEPSQDSQGDTDIEHERVQHGLEHDLERGLEPALPAQPEVENPPEKDPNLVEWDGPDDPENPQNFSVLRKWIITVTMSMLTVWITFSSSIFSTATTATAKEFNVSTEVMTLGTSLALFGFAVGPLVWAPMSELYGRRLPLFIGYTIFTIFQIPVAVAHNIQQIMIFRFLIGIFGCSPLAVVGGAMADLWNPVDRGVAIALFSGATFLGPIVGPIMGGFITQSYLGWRWTAWITLIAAGSFGILAFFVIPETYGPKILQSRAARLRKETKNWAYHSFLDEHTPTWSELVTKYLLRPIQMLILEPILFFVTIYLTLVYGILYLFFEAYPISFIEVRGWTNQGIASLPFIGIMIGVILGSLLIIYTTKTRFARKLAEEGRVVPEERLVPMMIASVLLPIGIFWFGWTAHVSSWVPQVLAGIPMGLGILVLFMQGLNYIIDVYLMFANSAIAANTFVRSMVGGGFPLFATAMYDRLGVGWASSVLGFISVAMIPIPILFFIYGAKIRGMSRFSPKF